MDMKKSIVSFCATLALGLSLTSGTADAQLRSQGKVITFGGEEDQSGALSGPSLDYAQEMRRLIKNIAAYGRQFKPDFLVILNDSKGLLSQIIDVDQLVAAPSSAFIRTLDGIMEPNLSYGAEGFGIERKEKDQKDALEELQVAKDTGLKVFTLDYASKPADVDKAIRFSRKNGFVPYVAPGIGYNNNSLPNWPRRPNQENAHTIDNIGKVNNYAFVRDSSRFGSADEFAMQMHNTNYDMLIVNVFHRRNQTHGRDNVRKMQFKKLGARRPVLAYINIGTANIGAYYWKDDWRTGNPPFILEVAPQSSDQYLVQYWHPGWHQVLYGNTQSFIYGIMKEGYDGILIDGANAYRIFSNPL